MTGAKIEFLSEEFIAARAAEFLNKYHPSNTIPIPIDQIAECDLRLSICYSHDLERTFNIVGFLSSDMRELTIDYSVLFQQPTPRFRFTIAHEIGHMVLHREIYESARFSTTDEWKIFINSFSEKDHSRLEYHANRFAGYLLVPSVHLRVELESLKEEISNLVDNTVLDQDRIWEIIYEELGKRFEVSKEVIRIRIDNDHLRLLK